MKPTIHQTTTNQQAERLPVWSVFGGQDQRIEYRLATLRNSTVFAKPEAKT